MTRIDPVQPEGWKKPSGYSNGVLVEGDVRWLLVAGQVAWDATQTLVGAGDFHAQFRQALENVVAVVTAAGGEATHVVEMTVYVTDKSAYLADLRAIGSIWRDVMGRTYPAMALVEVAGLLEDGALVEIQARAALPVD
jgi:enamine deaminase RidA (YjgF/YER057c/UK114 family)